MMNREEIMKHLRSNSDVEETASILISEIKKLPIIDILHILEDIVITNYKVVPLIIIDIFKDEYIRSITNKNRAINDILDNISRKIVKNLSLSEKEKLFIEGLDYNNLHKVISTPELYVEFAYKMIKYISEIPKNVYINDYMEYYNPELTKSK